MGLTNAQLLADQKKVFSDFPTEEITIDGTTYGCLVMEQRRGNEFDMGGLVNSINLRVAIERSAINGAIPNQGDIATYSSQSVRIGLVEIDDANSSVILTLENQTLR